jgi:DNA-directed RNA polymerase, mitochondrial
LGEHVWSRPVLLRIGKFLYDLIINEVKVDCSVLRMVETKQFVPAVYTVYRHHGNKLKEEVKVFPGHAQLLFLSNKIKSCISSF